MKAKIEKKRVSLEKLASGHLLGSNKECKVYSSFYWEEGKEARQALIILHHDHHGKR